MFLNKKYATLNGLVGDKQQDGASLKTKPLGLGLWGSYKLGLKKY